MLETLTQSLDDSRSRPKHWFVSSQFAHMTSALETLRTKYALLKPALNERARRLWAATEAMALGHGGIETVVQATGISRSTVSRGTKGSPADCGSRGSKATASASSPRGGSIASGPT